MMRGLADNTAAPAARRKERRREKCIAFPKNMVRTFVSYTVCLWARKGTCLLLADSDLAQYPPSRRLARDPCEPVERALQDEGGGVLVDHLGALLAARIGLDQDALDRDGREPLVPQTDRQLGHPRKVARKRARRLRARPFAAVHVDGQAKHEACRLALGG